MPILIFGRDSLFWIAALVTAAFFIDLATCWWYNGLNWGPLKKIRDKLVRYHKYTRIILIFLVIVHFAWHLLFQVFGIIF